MHDSNTRERPGESSAPQLRKASNQSTPCACAPALLITRCGHASFGCPSGVRARTFGARCRGCGSRHDSAMAEFLLRLEPMFRRTSVRTPGFIPDLVGALGNLCRVRLAGVCRISLVSHKAILVLDTPKLPVVTVVCASGVGRKIPSVKVPPEIFACPSQAEAVRF